MDRSAFFADSRNSSVIVSGYGKEGSGVFVAKVLQLFKMGVRESN